MAFPPRRTIYLLLLLLALIPYRGIVDDGLFNDDFSWLRAARYDMRPENFLTFKVVEFFRPLVNLSFWAMEKAFPGNIPLHYAANLVLHVLCTMLVFRLILHLLDDAAIAAASAALFAVTSVHASAILWISARTTLMSTFFLLASLNVLASSAGTVLRVAAAAILYTLALASKEEAISGLFLVGLLLFCGRSAPGRRPAYRAAFASFAAISGVYLAIRYAFMGGYLRENWGPGFHAIRNLAGGFMYQLYPWPFFSLFYPRGTYIPEPAGPVGPEILAVPLIALLVWAGYASRKAYAMNLAVGWSLLALIPESFFRYRFFSTVSITQSRYYYLSSVGSSLCIALLLAMIWKTRSRLRQGAAILIFVLLCAGSVLRDVRLERKWDDFTKMYSEVVVAIVEQSARFSGVKTLGVEGSPLAFPYLGDAVALAMPGWKAVEVKGKPEAERLAPCLYVSYTGIKPKLMRMEKIEEP